jgi:hypothetical protein
VPEFNPDVRRVHFKAAIGAKVAERTPLKIITADPEITKWIEAPPDRVEACFDDKNARYAAS